MKEFKLLKLVDRFRFIYEKNGVNYTLMRKILQLKLTMDERRVPTIMQNSNKKSTGNIFMKSLLIYALLGIFLGMIIFFPIPLFLKTNMIFGMIIFLVMTSMVSDFSTVLLDVKEKNILLPRPVDAKTFNAAKLTHIFIYLTSLTLSISAVSLVAGLVKYGVVFFIVFLVELILVSGFVLFVTSLLYYFVLKFFDGEKLKDIINYFQIVLSIAMMIAYQLMGRIFNFVNFQYKFEPKWWNFLLPSSWFAAPFSIISEGNTTSYFIILSVLAILIPVASTIIYFKIVAPYFEKSLQKLNNNSSNINKSAERRVNLHRKISGLICLDKTENIFYRFTQNMITNERKLKLKLYPYLAFAAVMPFIMLFSTVTSSKSFSDGFKNISNGKSYFSIYISVMMLSTCTIYISSSERYKGAWIYKVLPIKSPAPLFKGVLKGFTLRFIVPVYLFVSIVFTLICGVKIILDLILIFLNLILLILLIFMFSPKELPFYKDFEYDQGRSVALVFISLFYCGVCGILQFVLSKFSYGLIINCIIVLLLIILLWKISFKFKWKQVFRASKL